MESIVVSVAGESVTVTVPDPVRERGPVLGLDYGYEPGPTTAVVDLGAGNDSTGDGTLDKPYATVQKALDAGKDRLYLRGGTFHVGTSLDDGIDDPDRIYSGIPIRSTKPLVTITPYRAERVILDGSRPVTGWTKTDTTWSAAFSHVFDRNATDSYGQLDDAVDLNTGVAEGWRWVRSDFPMASSGAQVFLGGRRLWEVKDKASLTPGTFWVEGAPLGKNGLLFQSARYHLGEDPGTREVRISDRHTAFRLYGNKIILDGVTARRYANNVWMGGVIKASGCKDAELRNILVEDVSGTGISDYQAPGTLYDHCEVQRSGSLGFHGHQSDGVTYRGCVAEYANWKRYSWGPVSGGVKRTSTRGLTFDDCRFSHNWSDGLWLDQSVYDTTIISSEFSWNECDGFFLEIGAVATVLNNRVLHNGWHGIQIVGFNRVSLQNNTIWGSGRLRDSLKPLRGGEPRHLAIYDDTRRTSLSKYGQDARYTTRRADMVPLTVDPEMHDWRTEEISSLNFVQGGGNAQFSGWTMECVYSPQRSWEQCSLAAGPGVYLKKPQTSWWSLLPGGTAAAQFLYQLPAGKTSIGDVRCGTQPWPLDQGSSIVTDPTRFDVDGWLADDDPLHQTADPLTAAEAALIGVPAGTRHLGAFRRTTAAGPWTVTATTPAPSVVYREDFAREVAVGGWSTSPYATPWGVGPGLHAYPGGPDTSGRGTYAPDQVLSVTDGRLTWDIRTKDGQHLVAAVAVKDPSSGWGRRYGRFSFRVRADLLPGYKFVGILWPDSDNWAEGEVNFPEVHSLDRDHRIYANLFRPGDPSLRQPGDFPAGRQFLTDTILADGEWHAATIEWTPTRLRYELDGSLVGEFVDGIPTTPMHLVLQVESSLVGAPPADAVAGQVQVDSITIHSLDR